MSLGRPVRAVAISALALLFASCSAPLKPGAWGTLRYIGQVQGQPPLRMIPPISDRDGNEYTLNGEIGFPQVEAFVSSAAGGSFLACTDTKGDTFGAHGWVGFAQDRAWYWSGNALVLVPSGAACVRVLDHDPSTNVDLAFRAVVPWVKSTPSRTSLVALIQGATDPGPFSALIDLDSGIATNLVPILPNGASSSIVLGVGADPGNGLGFVLLSFTQGGAVTTEALFLDEDANQGAVVPLAGPPVPEYGVVGFLEPDGNGGAVGLTSVGSLVAFGPSGGGFVSIDPSIAPVGVHVDGGKLWLVGTSGGRPVIVPIGAGGQPGAPIEWAASEVASSALAGPLTVEDDRSFPARATTWATAASAMGSSTFLSAFSPWPHAPGTTLWVVAGPGFDSGAGPVTDIAVGPVGLSYP